MCLALPKYIITFCLTLPLINLPSFEIEVSSLSLVSVGDAGYDSEKIKQAVKDIGSKPIFVHNPRRERKINKRRTPKILKKVRVVIEQCNGFIKSEVMQHAWTIVKGLSAKAVFALTAVLSMQAIALFNLRKYNYPSIRTQEIKV